MRKAIVALLTALLLSYVMSGCMVYDPENYDKIHEQLKN